jgi:hypothetical protein
MKKLFNLIVNFFQKNGILKVLGSLALLALITFLYDKFQWEFLRYAVWIPGAYLIIAFLLLFGFAISNTIKDFNSHFYCRLSEFLYGCFAI